MFVNVSDIGLDCLRRSLEIRANRSNMNPRTMFYTALQSSYRSF
jgi:hypothetical protein